MRYAEAVTFGASGLNRAVNLRSDAGLLERAIVQGAGILPVWRGKPMVEGDPNSDTPALAFRRSNEAVFTQAKAPPILLGYDADEKNLLFARDVSVWAPEDFDEGATKTFLDTSVQRHPSEKTAIFRELRDLMTRLSHRDAELAVTARAILTWHRTHLFCPGCGAPTDIKMGGWQQDCAKCGTSQFPRTDPVVIMLITYEDRVLVGRSRGWPNGMYSLLAGFVEPGETIEAAVRREVSEEAGISVGEVSYLSSQPWPFPASLMVGCRGEALTTEITIDHEEIEDAKWVSRSEMLEVFAGNDPAMLPARSGAIAHFLLQHWLADMLD